MIIHDPLHLDGQSQSLKQQYVLAVLFFATNGPLWIQRSGFVDGEIDEKQYIEKYGKTQHPFLAGTLECNWYGI
ncbi:MAG: hypothetical protein ACRDL7_10920 [Gaiellaceae bacterium]